MFAALCIASKWIQSYWINCLSVAFGNKCS